MARQPSRPYPSVADLASLRGKTLGLHGPAPPRLSRQELERLLDRSPIVFYPALVGGLLARLERLRPREKWLRGGLEHFTRLFVLMLIERGEQSAASALTTVIAHFPTPRKTRGDAPTCDPLTLLIHYPVARGVLERKKLTHSRRWRNPDAMRLAVREAGRELYKILTAPPPSRFIPPLGKSVPLPDLLRCTCTCRTSPPPDLDKRIQKTWTQRDLILHLLAHHHALTPNSLRRLLDDGARLLRRIRQAPVKPGFPPPPGRA